MKLFLFLDDWFLDSRIDIVRRFAIANPVPIPSAHLLGRSSIIYDEEKKQFSALTKPVYDDQKGASLVVDTTSYDLKGTPLVLYKSTDGVNWKKAKKNLRFQFLNQPEKKVVIGGGVPFENGLFYDRWDPDRHYKMVVWPYPKHLRGGPGLIGCSSDGMNWTINPKYAWYNYTEGSDTNNNMFYNPFSKHWCVICRKTNIDRRVAMTESADLEHWTEPRIIVQPDVLDPPFLQFYGMVATLYENEYFIGLIQCFHVSMEEINEWSKGRVKMQGKVDAQLTYSYDGQYWLRADRSTIIPRTEPGSYGSTCIYPSSIVNPSDRKKIYIYSVGALQDHSKGGIPPSYPSGEALLLHTLRHDGFVYLEPVGGWGQFTTRTLVPNSGELTINYQAPLGQVLVQITDSKRKPLPGYSFADCLPLQGDKIKGEVHWKKHKDLSDLVGKPIHLEFRLFDARIYAIRLDCNLWYSYWPDQLIERI